MPDDQIFDDKARAEIPVDVNPPTSPWKNFLGRNKLVILVAVAVVVVLGIFWFFLSKSGTPAQPQSTNVVVTIKGPDQITSGNEAEYTITYRDGENADLTQVSLQMLYPSGFKFKSASPAPTATDGTSFNLPIVKQGQNGQVVVRGTLSGGTNEDKEIKAVLQYSLSNFNSTFQTSQSTHTTIQPPNLLLDINGPLDAVNGQDTTFNVTITNVSGQNFDNQALQLTYPDGFSFTSSSVPASKSNNYWQLNTIQTGGSQSIEITGSFTGADQEEKLVRADLGQVINNVFAPQITSTASFRVIPSSLALTIGATQPTYIKLGDTINYKVQYSNRGTIGLSNLVITVNIDSPMVDYSGIAATNAVITGHTVTWKSATQASLGILAPSQSGEVDFTVPVKNSFSTNLANQLIKATATITSNEITTPTRAADFALKIISSLNLSVDGSYISGAAPMQVGQTTLFGVTLLLSNLSNDLTDTVVTASLPLPSSAWNNVIIPDSEASRLSFDPNSGKIQWKVGNLAAFTGKFIPALKVTFQLAVTPADSDRGKIVKLLSNIQATATDSFVAQPIDAGRIDDVTTATIDDPVLNKNGNSVQ